MRTGVEQTRSQKEKAQREESKAESPPTDPPKPKELERRPVEVLKMLLRAGASLDNCRAGSLHGPVPKNAESCIQDAEGPRVAADADG